MRLIDADALRKELRKKNIPISGADVYFFRQLIDLAPTVNTTFKEVVAYECGQKSVERPTGHWIKVTDCYCWHWECENCHRRPSRTNTGYDDLSNFCPNCGAEMGKEAEE